MGMGTGTGAIFIQWGGDIYHTIRTRGYPFTSLVERKGVSFKLATGKKSTPKRTIQKFVEKENPDGIGSSKAFSAPALTTLPKDFISEIGNNTCSP
jgi:hypothetical protein